MTGHARREIEPVRIQRMKRSVRGLANHLILLRELADIRNEVSILDDRCAFFEHVSGVETEMYRDAAGARDSLLVQADRLLTRWAEAYNDDTPVTA